MAKVVNNTDKLTFILTRYGLERIAEALSDENIEIKLAKIKVGDANNEYYEPNEEQTDLRNKIDGGAFSIIDKALLEDGVTISLHAVFPEELDSCEIREVGIYETLNGEDYLFAISTQQPLLKPATELKYLISVDYYAFLKSENLADLYDRIVLDPSSQLVTEEDLEDLMRTILFTESNLVDQITSNSRIIGLNRARQLQEKIETSRERFSYMASYNNYSTLLDFAKFDDIFGYWVFNYPRRVTPNASIVDIGKKGRNFSSNKPINSYERVYQGFMPMLTFGEKDYFFLNQGASTLTFNAGAFNLFGEINVSSEGVADNFGVNKYVYTPELSLKEGSNWDFTFALKTRELTDENDRVVPQTIISSAFSNLKVWINSEKKLEVVLSTGSQIIGTLSTDISEFTTYKYKLTYNNSTYSLKVLEEDEWMERASVSSELKIPGSLGSLTLGSSKVDSFFKGTMDLKEVLGRENEEVVLAGGTYITENDVSFLNDSKDEDISFTLMFALEPVGSGDRTLLARSDYATNSHIFEVTEKADGSLEIILFSDSQNYLKFSTDEKVVPNSCHSLIISYNKETKNLLVYLNGRKVPIVKSTIGTYEHMNASLSKLYSFTYVPVAVGFADNPTIPTKVLNSDGSPYTGDSWAASEGVVFYNGNISVYDSSKNIETSKLYAWNYNDGLYDHIAYTKSPIIQADTIMYNEDYSVYYGEDFKIIPVGSDFVIQYKNNDTEYDALKDIAPRTLYAFVYTGNLQTIWSNSNVSPSVLYVANGDMYLGTDWHILDNYVYYKDGGKASYNENYNLTIPSLPLTSYVTNIDGTPSKTINSNVGVISVIKSVLTEEELRALSLNMEATMGKNPCVTTF